MKKNTEYGRQLYEVAHSLGLVTQTTKTSEYYPISVHTTSSTLQTDKNGLDLSFSFVSNHGTENLTIRGVTGPAIGKSFNGDAIQIYQSTQKSETEKVKILTVTAMDGVTSVSNHYDWVHKSLEAAGVNCELPSDTWIPQFAALYTNLLHDPKAFDQFLKVLLSLQTTSDWTIWDQYLNDARHTPNTVNIWVRLNILLHYCYTGRILGAIDHTNPKHELVNWDLSKIPGTTGATVHVVTHLDSKLQETHTSIETIGLADSAVFFVYGLRGIHNNKSMMYLGIQPKYLPTNSVFDSHTVQALQSILSHASGIQSFNEARATLIKQGGIDYRLKRNIPHGVPVCDGSLGFMPPPIGNHMFGDEMQFVQNISLSNLAAIVILGDGATYHIPSKSSTMYEEKMRAIFTQLLFGNQDELTTLPEIIRRHQTHTWNEQGPNSRERLSDDISAIALIRNKVFTPFSTTSPLLFI